LNRLENGGIVTAARSFMHAGRVLVTGFVNPVFDRVDHGQRTPTLEALTTFIAVKHNTTIDQYCQPNA
jgi:hypothetical protein